MGLYDEIAKVILHPGQNYDVSQIPGALSDLAEDFPRFSQGADVALKALSPIYRAGRGITGAVKQQADQEAAQAEAEAARLKATAGKGQLVQHKTTSNEVKAPAQAGPTSADTPHVIAQYRDESRGPSQALITRDWAGGASKDVKGANIPDFSHPGVSMIQGTPEIQDRLATEKFEREAATAQAADRAAQARSSAKFHEQPVERQLEAQKEAGLVATTPGASVASALQLVGPFPEYLAREKAALLEAYKRSQKPVPSDALIERQLHSDWLDAINKAMTAMKGRESFQSLPRP